MELVSRTAVEGRAGPVFPPIHATPPGESLADVRPFTQGQPWTTFARLRAEAPVSWHTEPAGGPGFWALTRYADVMRVNSDWETFSSQRGGILMSPGPEETRHPLLYRASMDAMINLDAPHHLELRRAHMPFFTPAYLAGLKARIADYVSGLIDAMAPLGECDLVEHFSSRLPLFTLCEILGVPEADRPKFLRWMHYLERAQEIAQRKAAGDDMQVSVELLQFIQDFNENVKEMFAYGQDMLKKRRAEPQEDLLTAIARAEVDGALLPDEYLDGSWLLIVFAGNDTTRNTLSGAMKLLTEHPAERARLEADASLLPIAAHEFIRLVSPVIYMRRTATRDVEIAGQRIAEGEKVVMYYGSANRDEAVFADPDRLDLSRPNADKHIAFGFGPHVCIGKRVAQIQLEEAYRQLLARLPDISWTGEIEIAPNNFVHAISRLGVKFSA